MLGSAYDTIRPCSHCAFVEHGSEVDGKGESTIDLAEQAKHCKYFADVPTGMECPHLRASTLHRRPV